MRQFGTLIFFLTLQFYESLVCCQVVRDIINSGRRSVFSYKFVEPRLKILKDLGTCLDLDHKEDFKKAYGNLLGILNTEGREIRIRFLSLVPRNYQSLTCNRSFASGEEGNELNLKPKGGTHGFTLEFLVEKTIAFADVGSWIAFNIDFYFLIYRIVLFPNMEGFVDLASIHILLSKNSIPTFLVDTYYSIHVKTHKKKGIIMCSVPLVCRWFILHLPSKGPFIENKDNLKWFQRTMSLTTNDIIWYSRAFDDGKVILNYGSFPNVPFIGTKGGINYNLRITLRQLGYPSLCKPNSEYVEEFVLYEGVNNLELLKEIIRAWREVCSQGRSESRKKNCFAKEAYTQWVKDMVEEIWLSFPLDPFMNIPQHVLAVVPISKVGKLKETIKIFEKENSYLRYNLGRLTREKEDLDLNLNQKRIMTSQAVEEEPRGAVQKEESR
ncbi:uncharacterized protein LOC127131463 [Lathyrus oleraceus]|uniref:uncharacterized protein LOC127131463 n=1 Tax=Pisum sativum TaxID=3888 RepID=UPI0021CEE9BC|nr:uncharacterized protein LOC127131463 [Pisum sativum]